MTKDKIPMETLVHVNNVSKKFARSLKRAMTYGLIDITKAALIPERFRSPNLPARLTDADRSPFLVSSSSFDSESTRQITNNEQRTTKNEKLETPLRASEFWACRDVSFEIKRGECLGIIGANGAGKSTIFKLLSGIYGPTEGHIEMRGQLSALLEVGAGFHHMLSGRENIYISGAIRGMTSEEINRKYEQIVEFSGVGDFIDMPIKFYSSGMLVRLGFAVLAHLEPDILLIDEILAVGDAAFQRQCIQHINKLRESNMAIALISHSLYRIESLCHRTIWLDHGTVKMEGDTLSVIQAYREHENEKAAAENGLAIADGSKAILANSDVLTIHSFDLLHADETPATRGFGYGEDILLRITYTAADRLRRPRFNFHISYGEQAVLEPGMIIDGHSPEYIQGQGKITCRLRQPRLLPKNYDIKMSVYTEEGALYLLDPVTIGRLKIHADHLLDAVPSAGPYALGHLMNGAVTYCPYEWDLSKA